MEVTITNDAFLGVDRVNIYHEGMLDVERTSIAPVGNTVTFPADSFSISAVTDAGKIVTVKFYDHNDKEITSAYVRGVGENPETIQNPLYMLKMEFGESFVGWADSKDAAAGMSIDELNADFRAKWESLEDGDEVKYYAVVEQVYVVTFNYVEGYPDGNFYPNKYITRAETTTMIFRLLTEARQQEIYTTVNSFSDVDAGKWYNAYVSSMARGSYVEGYPDGTFGGDKMITRAEFVTILVRFFGLTDAECIFSDVSRQHWAYKYIATATAYGWLLGYEDGTFRPDQAITRAEAVTVINRMLNRGVDETSNIGNVKNFPDTMDPKKWYYYEIIEAANDHEYTGHRPNEQWYSIGRGAKREQQAG